jgi:polyisoprenoid-binding protein YceI
MKPLALSILLTLSTLLQAQTGAPDFNQFFSVDNEHSYIGFSIKYMGAAKVRGRFVNFSGYVHYNEKDISRTSTSITIEAKSLDTGLEYRDSDLKSENWFDIEKFPAISFQSKKVIKTSNGFDLVGTFTMKGVTKEITLHMDRPSPVMKDVRSDIQVAFSGTASINRKEYGVEGKRWEGIKEGITAVADEVVIELNILGTQPRASNFLNWVRDDTQPAGKIYKLAKEQSIESALTEFSKITSTTEIWTLQNVGTMLRLEGKPNEALKIFEANKKAFPKEALVYFSLGEVYVIQGDAKNAKLQFEQTLKIDPSHVGAKEFLKYLK